MIKKSTDHQAPGESNEAKPRQSGCKAHPKLTEWQVGQYRRAIDENKWYMSEQLGRAVSWEEAEYDFLHNEYYGCAAKWRTEYCTNRCNHFSACTLGKRFLED